MSERKRSPTADERLQELLADRERVRRERRQRLVAGRRWRRMSRVIPARFEREGELVVRVLTAGRERVIEALGPDAVFALDTAMRLARGYGFLAAGDVHAYLLSPGPVERLAEQGLVAREPYRNQVIVRAWPGPSRLLAAIVAELPPHRRLPSGQGVVDDERLASELVGAVGARAALFALVA